MTAPAISPFGTTYDWAAYSAINELLRNSELTILKVGDFLITRDADDDIVTASHTMLASEGSLRAIWDNAEEDEAWSGL